LRLNELPESERFQQLSPSRKQFLDTIKRIANQAETSIAMKLRSLLTHVDTLAAALYATKSVYPGTNLRLIYKPDL